MINPCVTQCFPYEMEVDDLSHKMFLQVKLEEVYKTE